MAALLVVAVAAAAAPAEAAEPPPVRSLLEQRFDKVVPQSYDLSCGAASLATLLNYQHGDPVTEVEIALGLMAEEVYVENPLLVRLQEGFSLADLKRFVDARGYRGKGLGRLTFDHLLERAPIIVPIRLDGYSHFVVFRGVVAGPRDDARVLLADPSVGNRTLSRDAFEAAWPDYGELGKVGFIVERRDGRPPPDRLAVGRAGLDS